MAQLPKSGTWEARAYWQHVEQYALDPNLLDSDFFEGRGNMQGLYTAFAYSFTDAMIGTMRYGFADRINGNLGTGGYNADLPLPNPITRYQVVAGGPDHEILGLIKRSSISAATARSPDPHTASMVFFFLFFSSSSLVSLDASCELAWVD